MRHNNKPRLLVVATSAAFARVFLLEQMRYLSEEGYEVFLACSRGSEFADLEDAMPHHVFGMKLSRSIQPLTDITALFNLVGILIRIRPLIIHTHTPKAGIVGMSAAWLCGIRNRVHTIHGLRSETLSGWRLRLVSLMEKTTVLLSTKVIAVSRSLREEVIMRGIAATSQIEVLGRGACAGVDISIFNPIDHLNDGYIFRLQHQIPNDSLVVAYVGRIAEDKGVATLAHAWLHIRTLLPNAMLIIAGPLDETDPIHTSILEQFRYDARVRLIPGFTTEVATILSASNLAVQPSYREGLGVAALEASAMELPVIASNATGLVDAVVHNKTGLLVSKGDSTALADAMLKLLSDKNLRIAMGSSGRQFVMQNFDHRLVRKQLLTFYRSLQRGHDRMKRPIDVLVAGMTCLVLTPLMACTALLVWLRMGSPLLFSQQRAGLDGNIFLLFKFRTMRSKSCPGEEDDDSQRLTPLGRWLRKLSIDELPQLWNVLRGDMSLVGPRPLLAEYLPRYTEIQRRRHEVRPGLTGWAQVQGRNSLSWEDKFAMDIWYVDNRCLSLDLHILLMTVKRVFLMSNITPHNNEMMHEFKGTSSTVFQPIDPRISTHTR